MKLTAIALLAFVFSGCTHTLYTHRKDFDQPKRKGPWHQAYQDARSGVDPTKPAKRPLFRER